MSITATYLISLRNTIKDHAKGSRVTAEIVRTSPETLDTAGMSVISASINMEGVTFWSAASNNPYIDIGTYGRISVPSSLMDKEEIPLTEPSFDFSLNNLLDVGTTAVTTYAYAYKNTNGNICTYASNYAAFTITAICQEGYNKSTATVTPSVDAGQVSTVTLSNPRIESLSHIVTWSLGQRTNSSTLTAGVSSTNYMIPTSWLDQIPEATSATGSVTVETFNPSGNSLGSNTYHFTVTVPDSFVPIITLSSERIDGDVPSAWNVYVQGRSGVQITATASAGTGSSISNYTISGGYTATQTNNTFTINPIANSGSIIYTIKVTDKRGRSASSSISITVAPYEAPTITAASAFRCDENGDEDENGTYANVTLSGTIASVSSHNTKTLTVSFAESGTNTFPTAAALTDGVASVIGNGELNAMKSYQVRFRVSDAFGYTEKIVNVSTAAYTLFFKEGGNAVAVGKIAEHENALEINGDWAIYHGSDRLDGTVSISRGGTGATTVPGARNALGLGNTSGALPIANGGTGATTKEAARNALGLGNTSGALPVANGGTGSTTAANARSNLDITPENIGAASATHNHSANDITTGTLSAAQLPFRYAYGTVSCNASASATLDYSAAGFTAVPMVFVAYATTDNNWTGEGGTLKVHNKTTTSATLAIGGVYGTSRNIDWLAFGV